MGPLVWGLWLQMVKKGLLSIKGCTPDWQHLLPSSKAWYNYLTQQEYSGRGGGNANNGAITGIFRNHIRGGKIVTDTRTDIQTLTLINIDVNWQTPERRGGKIVTN